MGLKNLVVPKASVEIPGTDSTLSVRGLSTNDMTKLLNKHRGIMVDMFQRYVVNQGADPTDDEMGDIATKLMMQAPDLVADVIALASDEDPEQVGQLSFVVHTDALMKIFELTFGREEGLKKFAATMIQIFQAVTRSMKALRT